MDGYQMNARVELRRGGERKQKQDAVSGTPSAAAQKTKKKLFTPWVGAAGAYGCPRACQGTGHLPAVAAGGSDSRPSAAAARWSCSLGAGLDAACCPGARCEPRPRGLRAGRRQRRRHSRWSSGRERSNKPRRAELASCDRAIRHQEATYLNQVLALSLGDQRLQLGSGESVDEAGLGDDQQEDLGPSEDRQLVGLVQMRQFEC